MFSKNGGISPKSPVSPQRIHIFKPLGMNYLLNFYLYRTKHSTHNRSLGALTIILSELAHLYSVFLILKGRVSGSNENSEHILNNQSKLVNYLLYDQCKVFAFLNLGFIDNIVAGVPSHAVTIKKCFQLLCTESTKCTYFCLSSLHTFEKFLLSLL